MPDHAFECDFVNDDQYIKPTQTSTEGVFPAKKNNTRSQAFRWLGIGSVSLISNYLNGRGYYFSYFFFFGNIGPI